MNIRLSDLAKEPRHEQAAAWFMALHDEEIADETLESWQQWMVVEANRNAYDEVERLWHRVGDLAPMPMSNPVAAAEPVYDGSMTVRAYARANRSRPKKKITRRFTDYVAVYGVAAVFAAIGVAVLLALAFYRHSDPRPLAMTVFETAIGQHKEIVLSDGSQVQLGARSLITVNVNASERTVVLDRGEALFKVAHDPGRPFRVLAGGGTITAVGTAFNVRRLDSVVVVTVTEGTVKVEPRGGNDMRTESGIATGQVTHGHEVRYGGSEDSSVVRAVDVEHAIAWPSGRMSYSSEPLNRVIQDVNRYSRRSVAIADAAAGDIMYSGTVFERDVDDWLAALDKLFPEVEVVEPDEHHVIIRSRVAAR